MKRALAVGSLLAALVIISLGLGCYLPPTPTPHLGMTLPPAPSPGAPQGLVTPGITVEPQVGPTQVQPALPPGQAEATPFPTATPPSASAVGGTSPSPAATP